MKIRSAAAEQPKLTATEEEIVILVAVGMTNQEIARELDLSPRTVETYRLRLMKKMALPHLPALVKFAVRNGLAEL